MLAKPGRIVLDYTGALKCRYILYIFLILVFLLNSVKSEEAQCTKSTLKDHLRRSFQVLKLGRARNINYCINLCCSRSNCDLAILRNTRCYGITCSRHDLCRSIMNGLRERRHEISKRSTENTEDIPTDFSHHPRYHGFCRHRRVVPHHVFLEGGRAVSRFHKLATDVSSSRECNEYCCQRKDCALAFIMRDKCYGVICPNDGVCESGDKKTVPLHLEIALLQRRRSFGEERTVVDSDVHPESSERNHHHHHQEHETELPNKHHYYHQQQQQERSDDEDTKHKQGHETELPTKHRHHHHHHHDHHDHKTKYNMETKEDEGQRKESDHWRRQHKKHRHHHREVNMRHAKTRETHHQHHHNIEITHDTDRNSEEREDNSQDNEDNGRESGRHRQYHTKHKKMHHDKDVLQDASHDEREDGKDERNNRYKAHHKHIEMNSDMERNEDEDNDDPSRHTKIKRRHHRHKEMDSLEKPEDHRDYNDRLEKKHRKQEHQKTTGNREEKEESESHEKQDDLPKHHSHHHIINGGDIMEISDKRDEREEKVRKKYHEDDRENDSSENENIEHQRDENDDHNENMNGEQDNHEKRAKNEHRHKESQETSEETKDYKEYKTGEESASRKSTIKHKEMQDDGDDEESPKEQRHNNKDRGKNGHYDQEMDDEERPKHQRQGKDREEDKIHHSDEEMNIEESPTQSEKRSKDKEHHHEEEMNDGNSKKDGKSKVKNRKDSSEEDDDRDNEMENSKNTDHQMRMNEMDEHHHHHNDNVEDKNDNDTEEHEKESEEHHQHRHHKANFKPDIDDTENTDDKNNEYRPREKETNEKHHERNEKHHERNEDQKSSKGEDDLDNENIMSQNNAHELSRIDKPQQHSHRHEHTKDTHPYIHNQDKDDDDDGDSDERNLKSSKEKTKDSRKDKDYESSKKQTEDSLKKKKNGSRGKKRKKSHDNGEDERHEKNEEDERSEPKSKIHHEADDDESNENNDNERGENKIENRIHKKDKDKTNKHDYDDVHDKESSHDSKGDQTDSNKDERQSVEEHEDHKKVSDERRHDKKESWEKSERKNIKHIHAGTEYHKDHVKKQSEHGNNGDDKIGKNEMENRKGKEEFVKGDSGEDSEERNQKKKKQMQNAHKEKDGDEYEKNDHGDSGKDSEEITDQSKDNNARKGDKIKSKSSHETISDHVDHEDNDEKEDLSKKEDDKKSKGSDSKNKNKDETTSNVKEDHKNTNTERDNDYLKHDKERYGRKNENRDRTSSEHVHQKGSSGDKKNTKSERDNSEHGQEKDESKNENRQENDTDGVRKNHIDKSHSGAKIGKKINEHSSSESKRKIGLEHSGSEDDHKTQESMDEKQHEITSSKIGNTHTKNNTKNLDDNKLSNHELHENKNGKKDFEHEMRNNSDGNREKSGLVERIVRKQKQKAVIQKVTTENMVTKQHNLPQPEDHYTNRNKTPSLNKNQNDPHQIIDIIDSNDQDTSNTGRPKHKQSLYHNLKELKDNNTGASEKDKIKGVPPDAAHDIMKSNQDYRKSENEKKGSEDKTRFFNQETDEWKESFKGDQVDESGKYFNQRTRDWSANRPNTNTDYFQNLTSQWNLKNRTKTSDLGKYFNQRTKTWLGDKKNNNTSTGRGKENVSNISHLNGSMNGNKQQGTSRKLTSNDNQKKHEQHLPVRKHKLQSTIAKHDKEKPVQFIRNKTNVRKQLNHSRKSGKPTKVRQNISKDKNRNKMNDAETAEEKVKNEILKLIGEAPEKTTPLQKNGGDHLANKHPLPSGNVSNTKHFPHPSSLKQNNTDTLLQHKAKPHTTSHKKTLISKFPPDTKTQKVLKTSKFNEKVKSKGQFDVKRPLGAGNYSAPLKTTEKNPASSTGRQKVSSLLKQPKTKPIRPSQPSVIPIKKHSKFPKFRKKPVTSIHHMQPTTPQPRVETWKGTLQKPSYTPPLSSSGKYDYQKWNKQNIFDNEWKNVKWNSYYNTYGSNSITPTKTPSLPWDNSMAWNSNNGYQNGGIKERGQGIQATNYPNGGIDEKVPNIRPTLAPGSKNTQIPFTVRGGITKGDEFGGIGSRPQVLRPTLAPPYEQGVPINKNGALNHGAPTVAPLYRLGEFPLTGEKTRWTGNVKIPLERQGSSVGSEPLGTKSRNGDMASKRKDLWNQNKKIPYQQQGPQISKNPLDKPTPRRNRVYYFNNKNKQRDFNLTQVTKQPKKQIGGRTFVQPLGKITSLTPTTKTPEQPPPTRKTLPAQINNSRRPTVPPHITLKPNQWNKTWPTIGTRHPFKVNNIQPLQGERTTKDQSHPKVPEGCYPGEIMSEMTLENGLDAGNYTNLGRTELMDSCISKCCEIKSCEVAVQMDGVCFAFKCHSKDSCKIKSTLGKSSHHKLCFVSRKKKERQNIFDFGSDILGEQDVCRHEEAVGLHWKTTNAGSFDEIPCPKKAKGLARRKCSVESHWLLPDFSSCVTSEYEDLYQRAKRLVNGEDSSSLLQSLAVVTTRTIDNSLIFGGDLKKSTEIMTSIVQEQGARQDGEIKQKDMKNYLITCSNLLDDSNKQEWRNIQKDARGSADVLRDSQTYALIASSKLPEIRSNVTYVTNNIVVQMNYGEKGSEAKTFPDYTNGDVAIWDGEKDNIRLPGSVFSIGNLKTVTFSYKTLPVLLPMESNEHFRHSEPNSKILATIVEPRIQDKISPAVTITLHHLKQNRLNPRCVFWDFNLNPAHGGAWSREGCWLESSTEERTVCRCDHLANFAVLMDAIDDGSMQASAKDERYSKEMAALWFCIPVVVVLIIAGLYMASTWSRSPRRRTLSEKSSLLRSAVTTDEVKYDYSSTPSHNLKGATSAKHKELKRWNELSKHVSKIKDIGFDGHVERMEVTQEMEHDSGIESNDHDSHSDLSPSQETLETREEQFTDNFEGIQSPQYTDSIMDSGNASPVYLNTDFIMANPSIHLDEERRIFSSNLRRCCGQEDLSFSKE